VSVVDAANLSELEVIGRLAVAMAAGSVLGLERELDGHDAGLRTHALLALGAGVFGVISVGAFGAFASDTAGGNVSLDVTRVASYVAAGVGFLAGGSIVKNGDRVKGLTTAASLWVCAGVGLAAGLGFWVGALAGAGLALIMLLLDRPLTRLRRRHRMVTLRMRLPDDRALSTVIDTVRQQRLDISFRRQSDGTVELDVGDVSRSVAEQLMDTLLAAGGIDQMAVIDG
jgi:putative Mg2+ transporter-C (MgtC) family protein